MTDLDALAECERKIAALEATVRKLERRVEATINVATREATENVLANLGEALHAA